MNEPPKTPLDGWRLLENVIRLTGRKDRLALEKCLIATLREMMGAEELVLYESRDQMVFKSVVRAGTEAAAGEADPDKPSALPEDWGIAECVAQRREVMRSSAQGVRVALPVFGPDGVIGALALRCPELRERDRDLLLGFLRIYQNHLDLLLDNEHDTLTGLFQPQETRAQTFRSHERKTSAPTPLVR